MFERYFYPFSTITNMLGQAKLVDDMKERLNNSRCDFRSGFTCNANGIDDIDMISLCEKWLRDRFNTFSIVECYL
jgi:hypothetical protein